MPPLLRVLALLAAIAALAVAVLPTLDSVAAPTCTVSWDRGASTNSWQDPANWSTNALPGAADHVCLTDHAGSSEIVFNGTATVASIQAPAGSEPLRITGGTLTVTTSSDNTGSNLNRLDLAAGHLNVDRPGGGAGATIGTLLQTNGTLSGSATVSIGTFTWRGGEQDTPPTGPNANLVGTGVTTVTGTLSIEDSSPNWVPNVGNDQKDLRRELRIAPGATAELKGRNGTGTTGRLNLSGLSAKLVNQGTFIIRDDQDIASGICCGTGPGGPGSLVNTGTIVKAAGIDANDRTPTGAGESVLEPPLELDGIVEVDAGTLRVDGTGRGTHNADFRVGDGTTLRWHGGTHTVDSPAGIHRDGATGTARGRYSGTANVTVDAPYAVQETAVQDGTTTFKKAATPGPITLQGGRVNFDGTTTTSTLVQTGGALGGTAALTFTTITWRGGEQDTPPGGVNGNLVGTGVTTVTGTLSIEDSSPNWVPSVGNDQKDLRRELRIAPGATAELKGRNGSGTTGRLNLSGLSAKLVNQGTFIIRDDQDIASGICCGTGPGGPGALINTGTLVKATGVDANTTQTTGFGETQLDPPLELDGIVEVDAGTLRIDGTGTATHNADFRVGDATTLRWAAGTHAIDSEHGIHRDGSTGTALGRFSGTNATVTIDGPYALQGTTVDGGVAHFNEGTTTGPLTLSSGRANFNGPTTTSTLMQTGGTLGGSAPVTFSTVTWRGGEQDTPPSGVNGNLVGTGVTTVTGTLSIEDSSPNWVPNVGNDQKDLRRELRIAATATAELKGRNGSGTTGRLNLSGLSAKLVNQGTLTIRDDQDIASGICCGTGPGGPGALINTGTIVKAAGLDPNTKQPTGGGETQIDAPNDNDGTIDVDTGTFRFDGGGLNVHAGQIRVAGGSVLRWQGGTHTVDSDQGIVRKGASGTATGLFAGAAVMIDAPYTLQSTTLSAGRLDFTDPQSIGQLLQTDGVLGGTELVSVGTLTWRGGEQDTPPTGPNRNLPGTGVTQVTGTLSIEDSSPDWTPNTSNATKELRRELRIASTATAELKGRNGDGASGRLNVNGLSAKLVNHGTFTIRDDQDIVAVCCVTLAGPGGFVNTGTLAKAAGVDRNNGSPTGGGESVIATPIDNDGTFDVDRGTLRIDGTGIDIHTGQFRVADGTTLDWRGGTHTVDAAPGIVRKGATGTATGLFSGATVTLDAPYALQSTTLSGGRLNVTDPLTLPALLQTDGVLGGTEPVTLGALTWRGGEQDTPPTGPNNNQPGTGVTTVTGTLSIEDSSPTWAPNTSNKQKDLSRELRIAPDAVAELKGRNGDGQAGRLTLAGLSAKLVNQGTLRIRDDQDVVGSGTIVNAGTLTKEAGTSPGNGAPTGGGESIVQPSLDQQGGVVADAGRLRLDNLTAYNAATDTLGGGTYTVRATLALNQGPVATLASHLVLDGAASRVDDAQTTAADDGLAPLASVGAAGRLTLSGNKALTAPTAGGPLTNAGTVTVGPGSTLTGTGGFVNAATGTLRGTGTVAPSVQNAGTVEPGTSPGILTVAGTYTQTAAGTLRTEIDGANAGTGHDRLAVTGTATLAGTLDLPGTAQPALASTFRLVTCGTCTGTFTTVTGEVIDAERSYHLLYPAGAVDAVVARRAEPAIAVPDTATVTEGDAGTKTLTVNATLAFPTDRTVTVDWAAGGGTAGAADYTAPGGKLTFAPGQTTRPIEVTIKGDAKDEPDETFDVTLSAPVNGTLAVADAKTVATITDDDAAPAVSIGEDQFVEEPDAGDADATATLPIRLSAPSGRTVRVTYATANGTATEPGDYTPRTGQVEFAEGETEKTITVPVRGDDADEPAETLSVALSAPVAAALGARDAATVRIVDNDAFEPPPGPTPQVAVDDVAVNEGDGGVTEARFVVSLSEATDRPVTVDYATADGSAQAPGDYAARGGTLTFGPGQTQRTVAVPVQGDDADENAEAFTLGLSNPAGATAGVMTGTATIADDDDPAPAPKRERVEVKVEVPGPPVQTLVARSGDAQYVGCVDRRSPFAYRFVFPLTRVDAQGKTTKRRARVTKVTVLFRGKVLGRLSKAPFVARANLADVPAGLQELVANAVLTTPGSKRTTTKQFRYLFQVCP